MTDTLDLWLGGDRLASLRDLRGGFVELAFTDEAVRRHGEGSRLLSLSLPMREEPYGGWEAMPFLEGLLPEGPPRERLSQVLRISSADSFRLLSELGRDCAGAVVIVAAGRAPPEAGAGSVDWLTERELEEAIARLPDAPLGLDPEGRVRLSLAGVQDKLVVCVRRADGVVGLPVDGHPSTHILKPTSAQRDRAGLLRFPALVENEAFCLALAAASGLRVANAEVRRLGSSSVLLVERFDRRVEAAGTVRRLHQEDVCQALGIDPLHKYEEHGGPSLPQIADLLRRFAATPIPDIYALLDLTMFNVLIGNCDAHGKNFSVLHPDEGGVAFAPGYDLVSTTVYPATRKDLAMRIGPATNVDDVDRAALVSAFEECGIAERVAHRRISALLERVSGGLAGALEQAATERWRIQVVDDIGERVAATLDRLAR